MAVLRSFYVNTKMPFLGVCDKKVSQCDTFEIKV